MESAIIQIDRKCKYIATNGSGRSHDAGNTGIMPRNAADKVTSRKRNSYNLVKNIEKNNASFSCKYEGNVIKYHCVYKGHSSIV